MVPEKQLIRPSKPHALTGMANEWSGHEVWQEFSTKGER
jgi:hypothetical protein